MMTTAGSMVIGTLVLAASAMCPPLPDGAGDDGTYTVEMQNSWAVVRSAPAGGDTTSPADDTGAAAGRGVVGEWLPPRDWPVIAIHAALLPTGEVLHYSYPGGSKGSRARLWNPATGVFTNVDWNQDLFCSGHSHLANGLLYVTGGNDQGCDFRGLPVTNLFDPVTRQWTPLEDMVDGRWYPSNVMLPDGRVLILSGLDRVCDTNAEMEMFTPGEGLSIVDIGRRAVSLYPRLHLLTSGRVAHVGPENGAWTFALDEGWQFVDRNEYGWRSQGTSVLVPGRTDQVMIIGGGNSDAVTATCEIIDFAAPKPAFRYTGELNEARAHADALILPDKTVLVVGGGRSGLYGDAVYTPELFDPETESWQPLAPHVYPRMYHGTTVLLPDGRVLVAGQDDGEGRLTGEIFLPPYLFRGPRPRITTAPALVPYGRSVTVETPDADGIGSVVLVRLSSVTHSVNFEQRLVDLDFTPVDGALRVTAPASPFVAPPGYYLLFIVSAERVPSEGAMVHVVPWTTGDANGDGIVDFADLLLILGSWGDCPPPPPDCPADVDGSGSVDFADILAVLANWS